MLTHSELIDRAFNWLRGSQTCAVVISELATSASEKSDALGWKGGLSILVEAKASLSDFRADSKKVWRRHHTDGLGVKRFYIVGPEVSDAICKLELLPAGWGLLVCKQRGIEVREFSRTWRSNARREIDVLLSVIRRIAENREPLKGVGVRCYIHELSNTKENPVAALSIGLERITS